MKITAYNGFFKAMCNQTRLNIIISLQKGPKCVNEIVNEVKMEQSRVSHSLQCLEKNGFVKVTKNGKQRIYTLNNDTIEPILNAVSKHVQKYNLKLC